MDMMTAEKVKQSFNVWSHLLVEGLNELSSEDSPELGHVEHVFEQLHLSKQELEMGMCGSLHEKDTVISRLQKALDRRFEDLEKLQALQKRRELALHDVRVALEKAIQELAENTSCVLKEHNEAIAQLQEVLKRNTEDSKELQKCLKEANEQTGLMEMLFTEYEAKMKDQEVKVQNLMKTLEEQDQEIQNLKDLQKSRDLELCNVRTTFEKEMQELEVNTSLILKRTEQSVSELQEALDRKSEDLEEVQRLLFEAKQEIACKELLHTECVGKLGDQEAKVHSLTRTFEEKDRELQNLQAVQKRRDEELHTVRLNFDKAIQDLEVNASHVLKEDNQAISQLHGALDKKTEDLVEAQKLLVEAKEEMAFLELVLSEREVKLQDQEAKIQNLTRTLEDKDRELQESSQRLQDMRQLISGQQRQLDTQRKVSEATETEPGKAAQLCTFPHEKETVAQCGVEELRELQPLRGSVEETLYRSSHLCGEGATTAESVKNQAMETESETQASETTGPRWLREEGELVEEGQRRTPARPHITSEQHPTPSLVTASPSLEAIQERTNQTPERALGSCFMDQEEGCSVPSWYVSECKETAHKINLRLLKSLSSHWNVFNTDQRDEEELAKMRAKIHLKLKNGQTAIRYVNKSL